MSQPKEQVKEEKKAENQIPTEKSTDQERDGPQDSDVIDRPAQPVKDTWDKWAIVSRIVLPIVLALLTPWLVHSYQQQNLLLEMKNQRDTLDLQRRTIEARIATDLLPFIVNGSEEEKTLSLFILNIAAPEIGNKVLSAVESTSTLDDQVTVRIRQESQRSRGFREFEVHLTIASGYQDLGLNAQAYREYRKALESLPEDTARTVPAEKTAAAEAHYEKGEWAPAARLMAEALQEVKGRS